MGPELFGVGFAEAVLVLVIALILVGPQRFPEIARQSGRWYRVARRYTAAVTADLRGAMEELEEEVKADAEELRSVREIGDEFESSLTDTATDLDQIAGDAAPDDIDAPPAAPDGGSDGSAPTTPQRPTASAADEDGGDGQPS